MDVKRAPKGKRKKYVMWAVAGLGVIVVTFALSRLEPAAPTVDRNVIVLGTVERGDMVREVRGSGTLVPERVQFVAALTAGRVVSRYFEPGQTVSADDVIVSLANPDVELQVLQAEQQWTAAKASLVSLRQSLGSGVLAQEAAVARARADFSDAEREAEAFERLVEDQLVSENEYRRAQENVEAVRVSLRTEQDRLDLLVNSAGRPDRRPGGPGGPAVLHLRVPEGAGRVDGGKGGARTACCRTSTSRSGSGSSPAPRSRASPSPTG